MLNNKKDINYPELFQRCGRLSYRGRGNCANGKEELAAGFTLIELLVVISIIALLMSILLPSLKRARVQAKKVVCQSKLKQWSTIIYMYTEDNNGRFQDYTNVNNEGGGWPRVWASYYVEPDLLFCPMATKTALEGGRQPFQAWGKTLSDDNDYFGSYGINLWVLNISRNIPAAMGNDTPKVCWKTPRAKGELNNVPLFLDCYWKGSFPQDTDTVREDESEWVSRPMMNRFCLDRHTDGTVNCLFMDFSVRDVGLKELWKLKWHKQFDTNNMPSSEEWPQWMRSFKNY